MKSMSSLAVLLLALIPFVIISGCDDTSSSCAEPFADCEGICTDLMTDNNNCGECGNICNSWEECTSGNCKLVCSDNQTECNGECVNLLTDSRYCSDNGSCGTPCDDGYICNGSGVCELTCQNGLTDCNGECVNLLTDSRYCSSDDNCGAPCDDGYICNGSGVCE
ncbi:MAG: hypothetical protein JXR95_03085, partial [Deltaproteobacteria bacterium]|nr:hypothetical protein [Deltaproteobacteria bacterium]